MDKNLILLGLLMVALYLLFPGALRTWTDTVILVGGSFVTYHVFPLAVFRCLGRRVEK